MKKLGILLSIFVAVIALSFSTMNAQQAKSLKLGVVDVEKIVKEMPEAAQADQILKELQKSYQEALARMQNSLMQRAEAYQKQRSMMPADQPKKEEESLKMAEQELYRYKDAKFAEISEKRELYLAPIRKKVAEAIEGVAKDESISFVFDKANGTVLYSEEKSDITFKVIDKMKRGSK